MCDVNAVRRAVLMALDPLISTRSALPHPVQYVSQTHSKSDTVNIIFTDSLLSSGKLAERLSGATHDQHGNVAGIIV